MCILGLIVSKLILGTSSFSLSEFLSSITTSNRFSFSSLFFFFLLIIIIIAATKIKPISPNIEYKIILFLLFKASPPLLDSVPSPDPSLPIGSNVIPTTEILSPLSVFIPIALATDFSKAACTFPSIFPSMKTEAVNLLTSPGALIVFVSVFPIS